jgi:hypothetical protein
MKIPVQPKLSTFLSFCALAAACGDQPPKERRLQALEGESIAYGAVSSDFTASAVSILGPDGELVADDYIDSGSTSSGLVTVLSGDVALPTLSGENGTLVLLDRFKTDVITRIRLSTGEVLGQVKTHTPPPEHSQHTYSSNPHDYVYIDPTTAWISRHEPNLDPGVPAIDRGTDLLRINPSTMERTNERIDLSSFNGKATRVNLDTMKEEEVDVYARPSSIVRVGNTLVVGLARLAFDFSADGTGAVAAVDLTTKQVTGLELEGLTNCDILVPVPGAQDRVIVSCTGSALGDTRATAGLVELSVANGKATVARSWKAQDHASDPISVSNPISLGGARVAAVAVGSAGFPASDGAPAVEATPDVLAIVDLDTGKQETLFEAEGSYVLGIGAFDAKSGLLLVPDASLDKDMRPSAGVHRFKAQGNALSELPIVQVATGTGLPVRQIAPL